MDQSPSGTELPVATQRLLSYLASDPDNLNLRADVVDQLLQARLGVEAKTHALHALRLVPQDGAWQYRMAVAEHYAGELSAAVGRLQALVQAGVEEPVVRHELATVLSAMGDWAGVEECLAPMQQRALPEPLAESVTFLRVRALHWLGRLDEALTLGRQFLQLMPQASAVATALATLCLDAHRPAEAAELYELAAARGPVMPEMDCVGGFVALDAAQPEEALTRFERSLAKAPELARTHLGLGLTYALVGHLPQAMGALQRATELMPGHLGTWHALAWMHLMNSDVPAAQACFERAMAADRTFGETHGGFAIIAALSNRPEEARAYIRAAQKLNPDSVNAGAAKVLLQNGGDLRSPEFVAQGLKVLQQRALEKDPHMQALFQRMSALRSARD
jgi:tetratricopeptide (TPR) repeat protein